MPVLVFRRFGVMCLGVLVFKVNDIWEGQKGDQGGAQKWPKINVGKNRTSLKLPRPSPRHQALAW